MAGKLFQITRFVEEKKTSFAVGRLVMLSGVNLRKATVESPDDAAEIAKVMHALTGLLSHTELAELRKLLG